MSLLDKNDKIKLKRPSKGRVFQCTGYPDCNMSFTRLEHLARHKRKHTGERPFTCPHCSKNFSRLDNLRQHKQTVHAYENFIIDNNNNNNNSNTPGNHLKDNITTTTINYNSSHSAGNPETPNNPLFDQRHHQPVSYIINSTTPLISPPNSNSPHYPITYIPQYQYIPYDYQQGPPPPHGAPGPVPGPGPHPHAQHQLQHMVQPIPISFHQDQDLKLPANQFKPKRRPRPLSLLHSFTEPESENNSPTPSSSIKTAPISNSTSQYLNRYCYNGGPKSASLTPNMVSPLSPLFHQSFNQSSSSLYKHSTSNNLPEAKEATATSLPIPTNFKPIIERDEEVNVNVNKIPSMDILSKSIPKLNNTAPTTTNSEPVSKVKWLKDVLNEPSTASTKLVYILKKPTINSLLSPYDDDKFSEDLKD